MPRYRAICDGWQRTPPLCVSAWVIAESLGAKRNAPPPKRMVKGEAAPADTDERKAQRQSLIEMFGGTAGMALKREKRPAWQTTQ